MSYSYVEFVNTICTIVQPLCTAKNINFCIESDTTSFIVNMDPTRMVQIFINLLSNAVKFTPEGGRVELIIRSDCTDAGVACTDFLVRDNGIGISEAFQKRMFEPFAQESNPMDSRQQGTGLGLSIVKNLVELMGGTILVESQIGKGTEFTVHLDMPIIGLTEKKSENPTDIAPDEALQNKHVLLVEDHPMNMQIAQKLLEKKKMRVTCVPNGKAGLDAFESAAMHTFDAILMDIRMPVMDGLEATRRIRSLARSDAADIPIIAMSANAFAEDVQDSLRAGMNAHLAKPVNPLELYQELAKWMQPS